MAPGGDGSEHFDAVAAEYDRRRPGYPEDLIDRAFEVCGLRSGDRVLEIGCGTGQLTRSLLARGLRVTAVEPGAHLAAIAREALRDAGDLEIVAARFEDAELPRDGFRAVFAASAIHWVDPDIGWRRAAEALAPRGALVLLQHFGLDDAQAADDQRALLGVIAEVAPEVAETWPRHRNLETIAEGVRARRGNISEVWAWLTGRELARDRAASLFDDAEIAARPQVAEQTAAEVRGLLATFSFWSRLSSEQRAALDAAIDALEQRLGRPFRASIAACMVTARRAAPSS